MPDKSSQKPPSTARVALTIGLAMIETLLFSGVSYGVVSLVPMLESRGVYGHLCSDRNVSVNFSDAANVTRGCSIVQDQVTLAFTITQVVTPFGNLVSGLILDRLGFRVIKAVAAVLFGLGSLCFTLVQPGVDWLIFPGTMMLGISGIQVVIANFQLAPMVKLPFVVASLISGLFDACTMVTSTLVIISNSGVNSFAAFGVYTGLGVATIVLTIALYPGRFNLLKVERESSEVGMQRKQQQRNSQRSHVNETQPEEQPTEDQQIRGSLKQQLLSTDFFLMIVWMICSNLRMNYFFGSLNAYVDVITGDKKQVEYHATIFGYFFLASPLISLVPGTLLDFQKRFIPTLRQNTPRAYKLNTVTTLSLTGLVGVLSCLMILPNSASILIPVYVAISVHRAFLFSTLGNYCISVFSPEYFGITYTSIICTAAPFMFLTVPLTNWLKDAQSPNQINGILAGLSCASLIHPLIILLRNLPMKEKKQVMPTLNGSDWNTHL